MTREKLVYERMDIETGAGRIEMKQITVLRGLATTLWALPRVTAIVLSLVGLTFAVVCVGDHLNPSFMNDTYVVHDMWLSDASGRTSISYVVYEPPRPWNVDDLVYAATYILIPLATATLVLLADSLWRRRRQRRIATVTNTDSN